MPNHQLHYPEAQEGLFYPSPRPTRRIFERVVSGCQTGAYQGALDAALKLGHPCGGWCPKGRKSEAGPIPDEYPLQEHSSASYVARTEANVIDSDVIDSDGTLIFTYGEPTGGTALTVKLARLHRKPVYLFDFEADALNQDPEKVWLWGHENNFYEWRVKYDE